MTVVDFAAGRDDNCRGVVPVMVDMGVRVRVRVRMSLVNN